VIGANELARAEQVLQVAYGQPDYGRQLSALQVEREAFDNLLHRRVGKVQNQYKKEWKAMDPRMEPALNTLFMHFFLVGVVAGRHSEREIV
jgi:hypothetical protein